jgi:hypothetical protein
MTRARGRERQPVRRAQVRRNPRLERLRLRRLEQAGLVGDLQARGVDRDQDVGRTARALALDPLDQLVLAAVEPVDLDPGLTGEDGVEGLVGLVVDGPSRC